MCWHPFGRHIWNPEGLNLFQAGSTSVRHPPSRDFFLKSGWPRLSESVTALRVSNPNRSLGSIRGRCLTGDSRTRMSVMGHELTSRNVSVMPVILLKADIHQRGLHVRFVP